MPISTVFEKIVQGPGPVGPSIGILLHAGEQAFARINVMENAWDSSVIAEMRTESSADGGVTWLHETTSIIQGGSHQRDGLLPGQTLRNDTAGDRLFRVTLTLNSELSIGVNLETP